MKNIAVGTKIILKNIFFDTDKYFLRDESIPELQRLMELLNTVPTMKIEISGHTDSRGSDSHNQTLSQNQINSLKKNLLKNSLKK